MTATVMSVRSSSQAKAPRRRSPVATDAMANERSSQLTGYRAGDFVRLVVAALALALARKRQRDQAVGRRRRAMPPAFGENRAGGPLREGEPAAVLERV